MLTPSEYDLYEQKGAALLPNRIIECCKPAAFNTESYPIHVSDINELSRYVDVMHEGRLEATFDSILEGGITEDEMKLLLEVMKIVGVLSKQNYQKEIIPKDALLRALNVYRHISFLYPERDITILEVGAGSGYVGALLMLSGYGYISTDITQAFYVFQNHLMNAISPGKVIELASEELAFSDVEMVKSGTALHVPWWKFTVPNPKMKLGADLVTANHCLCEMHRHASAYTLKLAKQMLMNKNADGGTFLFEGWGSTINNQIWTINKLFSDLSYVTVHNDTLVTVYKNKSNVDAIATPVYPVLPPVKTNKSIKDNIIDRINFILKNTEKFSMREVSQEQQWHPSIWITDQNPVSMRIVMERNILKEKGVLNLVNYIDKVKQIKKSDNILTDDEVFLNYINQKL